MGLRSLLVVQHYDERVCIGLSGYPTPWQRATGIPFVDNEIKLLIGQVPDNELADMCSGGADRFVAPLPPCMRSTPSARLGRPNGWTRASRRVYTPQ
jgi:hypothetical protein